MRRHSQTLLILGFTAIFIGYLSVWLRGPGAGLTFLGLEMGEWFKFLGLGSRRDLFYLPPIILGFMLALWTVTWPPRGYEEGLDWRAWSVRGIAILVSLLTFPAIEDISGLQREQYLLRAALVMLVIVVTLAGAFWRPHGARQRLPWAIMAILGVLGAMLPSWLFFQVKPYLGSILGLPVSADIGFWLNLLGNMLVAAIALYLAAGLSSSASKAS